MSYLIKDQKRVYAFEFDLESLFIHKETQEGISAFETEWYLQVSDGSYGLFLEKVHNNVERKSIENKFIAIIKLMKGDISC